MDGDVHFGNKKLPYADSGHGQPNPELPNDSETIQVGHTRDREEVAMGAGIRFQEEVEQEVQS